VLLQPLAAALSRAQAEQDGHAKGGVSETARVVFIQSTRALGVRALSSVARPLLAALITVPKEGSSWDQEEPLVTLTGEQVSFLYGSLFKCMRLF